MLRVRDVYLRELGGLRTPILADLAHDADDGERAAAAPRDPECLARSKIGRDVPAEDIGRVPELASELLAHDRDAGMLPIVSRRKVATRDDRNADGTQIVRAHDEIAGDPGLIAG